MSTKLFRSMICLLLCLVATSAIADLESAEKEFTSFFETHGQELAYEWRLPSGNDFSRWGTNTNMVYYKSIVDGRSKHPYWVKSDFNSDGIMDWVFLLFNNSTDKGYVFAFVSNSKDSYTLHKIIEADKHHTIDVDFEGSANSPRLIVVVLESDIGTVFVWNQDEQKFNSAY